MFTRYSLAIGLLIGLFAVSHVFADFYKYRDKDGVLRFTDDLGEVPADQRPQMQRYRETKPVHQGEAGNKRAVLKKGKAQTAAQSKSKGQTEVQWLIREQRNLDKIYRELMNEKMTLANQSAHIKTPAEAKAYRLGLKDLNSRIAKFEKRRYKYLHRAGNLKDQIEMEKQRQERPPKSGGPPRTCGDSRRCGKQPAKQ